MQKYQRQNKIKAHCGGDKTTLVHVRNIEVTYKASIKAGRKGFKECLNA